MRSRRNGRGPVLAVIFLVVSLGNGSPALADPDDVSPSQEVALSITSLVATIPYGAAKLTYAGLGAIVGGFHYLLSGGDFDSAASVWNPSLRGTYVLTPKHLSCEEPIRFIGP